MFDFWKFELVPVTLGKRPWLTRYEGFAKTLTMFPLLESVVLISPYLYAALGCIGRPPYSPFKSTSLLDNFVFWELAMRPTETLL